MLLLIRGISHTHTHAWTICASDACGVKIYFELSILTLETWPVSDPF